VLVNNAAQLGTHPFADVTPPVLRRVLAVKFAPVRAQQAVKRELVPDDVAGAVAYLVSDAAAALTGQALRIDGGVVTL